VARLYGQIAVRSMLRCRPRGLWRAYVRQATSHQISNTRYDELLEREMTHLSLKPYKPITIDTILALETEKLGPFLAEEVSTRYATRIKAFEEMLDPYWKTIPELKLVRQMYATSFKELRSGNPDESSFYQVVKHLRNRHRDVVKVLMTGIKKVPKGAFDQAELDEFLDYFFASRIGTEMLTTQFLLLNDNSANSGIVTKDFDPLKVIESVVRKAQFLCRRHLRKAPQVEISVKAPDPTLTFVQTYFAYIMFEVLKNSFRATVEHHRHLAEQDLPAVRVSVCCDETCVVVKIADEGGGIPLEHIETVWSYLYTTASRPAKSLQDLACSTARSRASAAGCP